MRGIVTLALILLIGGYGTARAQDTTSTDAMAGATADFLGLKWGLGIGVMGSFGGEGAVEKASVVGSDQLVRVDEEGDLRPQTFLEMHVLVVGGREKMKYWRDYKKHRADYKAHKTNTPPTLDQYQLPLQGFGPFVALQSGSDDAIDALAVGWMWGRRKSAMESSSFNIGVGLSFDPSVQVLGDGVKEGQKLPDGETEVRYKKEGRFGWA